MSEFKLGKQIWGTEDFESMGWHDCFIHALAFGEKETELGTCELTLDIDYILKWVETDRHYQFWVAPCSLVFSEVHKLKMSLEANRGGMEMDSLTREPQESSEAGKLWMWTITAQEGELSFLSTGYKQYVRSAPILTKAQILSDKERGGFSFEKNPAPAV
jgi:hypothetical protein